MSYGAYEAFDDLLSALDIDTDSSEIGDQTDLMLAEIDRLQKNQFPAMNSDRERVGAAIVYLRHARDCLVLAECPMAANKVRRALKSAEGALRNQSVRENRARYPELGRVPEEMP